MGSRIRGSGWTTTGQNGSRASGKDGRGLRGLILEAELGGKVRGGRGSPKAVRLEVWVVLAEAPAGSIAVDEGVCQSSLMKQVWQRLAPPIGDGGSLQAG